MEPSSPGFNAIDDASASLIIQLQYEDIEKLQASSKGKGREDTRSDFDLVMSTFQEELQEKNAILSDRSMSRSIARALATDSGILLDICGKEAATANDRRIAERLNAGYESILPEERGSQTLDDLPFTRLKAVSRPNSDEENNTSAAYEDEPISSESSASAASRSTISKASYYDCISCNERKQDVELSKLPCGHYYCQQCLSRLFELSTVDESLFPPRCCRQNIPLESARVYLNSALIQQFEKKSIEFETVDRTYCSKLTCASFIPPTDVTRKTSTATCSLCYTRTCTICKGNTHNGDCPEDPATQLVLALAQEQGWQSCYNCQRMVELDFGCFHMTCRCGAQFCYLCGLQWKTCACDFWTDDRLLARAEQVVARDRPAAFIPVAEQAARIQQVVDDLQAGHICEHVSWRFVNAGQQCEECRHHLQQYIFECRQCRIRVCNRCKRNRL